MKKRYILESWNEKELSLKDVRKNRLYTFSCTHIDQEHVMEYLSYGDGAMALAYLKNIESLRSISKRIQRKKEELCKKETPSKRTLSTILSEDISQDALHNIALAVITRALRDREIEKYASSAVEFLSSSDSSLWFECLDVTKTDFNNLLKGAL